MPTSGDGFAQTAVIPQHVSMRESNPEDRNGDDGPT